MPADSSPLVSVIMNCLNCEKYLREAIDSVYAQTYANWEIVFWDNASTDQSAQIAGSYDQRLRYFRGDQTISLGAARNKALEQARGDFLAFLDCDDLWMPDKLEKQIPLGSNRETGFVFSDAIYFSDSNKKYRFRLYGNKHPPVGNIFPYLLKNYFLCLSTVVVNRKTLMDIVDLFDERLKVAEEADLFLRIAYKWNIYCINEPLVLYRMHAGSITSLMHDAFPKELELIYDKLLTLYPYIKSEYRHELDNYQANIQYLYALGDLRSNAGNKVRKRITPYLMVSKKLFVIYFFSFFPFSFYNFVLKLKTKRYAC